MKKLVALIAVLGFVPYAHAADGAEMSHNGDFRLQYKNNMEADLNSDVPDSPAQTVHQRMRVGTTIRAGEKMTGHLSLVHNSDWGTNASQTPDDIQGGATNNVLTVNEAYMAWMASDSMMIKAGRGTFTMADGRVISSNDYEYVQKAFDGVAMVWDHEAVRMSFFGVQGAKATGAGNFNDYGKFMGVVADFKSLPDWMKMANLYYIAVKRDAGSYEIGGTAQTFAKDDSARYGFTVAGDVSGFDWRATYSLLEGEAEFNSNKRDTSADMMDFEFGYTMPDMMNFRVWAGYHADSGNEKGVTDGEALTGDNNTYTGFHYDTHANAGLMDFLGWGNLTYTRVGFSMAPMDDLTVMAEYFMFSQTEKKDSSYTTAGRSIVYTSGQTVDGRLTGTSVETEDDLGTELDLVVNKKYNNNFNISARYSMFTPGDEFEKNATKLEDTYTQLYLEGKMSF